MGVGMSKLATYQKHVVIEKGSKNLGALKDKGAIITPGPQLPLGQSPLVFLIMFIHKCMHINLSPNIPTSILNKEGRFFFS